MKKLLSILFLAVLAVEGFLGYQIYNLKNKQNELGQTIPTVVALFETSLQSAISSTATSATLVKGTDKRGTTLSGTIGFVIDEGTASEEFVICSVSGTALTSCTRGIDVQDGKTAVTALQFTHRRGASIKITNFPQLALLSRIANGQESFPNLVYYKQAMTFTTASSSVFVDKNYVDSGILAGCTNANETVKGCSELATVAEINAGTGLGGTGARLFINPSYLASSNYGLNIPTAGQKAALSGSSGTPGSTNLYITQNDVSSVSFSDSSDKVIRSDGDTLPTGLWVDITRLNIAASASGDMIYRSGTTFTRFAIGAAGSILTVSGGAPTWGTYGEASASSKFLIASGSNAFSETVGNTLTVVKQFTTNTSSSFFVHFDVNDGNGTGTCTANLQVDGVTKATGAAGTTADVAVQAVINAPSSSVVRIQTSNDNGGGQCSINDYSFGAIIIPKVTVDNP